MPARSRVALGVNTGSGLFGPFSLLARGSGAREDLPSLPDRPSGDVASGAMPEKYREVRSAGWDVSRQRESREVWGKPGETARIVVAGKDSDTVPVGTLSSIRRASGPEHLR
ncbi:MAG: type II toxin-antitoxin system HicA family toxin [Actinobacteria bacterium]|nr:type II toxin-antitoxin system HicA family toxin [Actinomycetota bacterium]